MEFGVSTFGWQGEPLSPEVLEYIRRSGEGGRRIEVFGNLPHFDYRNNRVVRELAGWFTGAEVAPPDLHLPFFEQTGRKSGRWISALHSEERDRQDALDEIRRALEWTDRVAVGRVVVHLGVPGQPFGPVLFDHAYRLIDTIRSFADVEILVETLRNDVATPSRLREFLDVTGLDRVGICHDVAHSELGTGDFDRVGRIHLSDPTADRSRDDHPLGPDHDATWAALVESLVRKDYTGDIVFEVGETDGARLDAARSRIVDLIASAEASVEEFRGRHGLPVPASEVE